MSRNTKKEESGTQLKTTQHLLKPAEHIRGPKSAGLWRKCWSELTHGYSLAVIKYE